MFVIGWTLPYVPVALLISCRRVLVTRALGFLQSSSTPASTTAVCISEGACRSSPATTASKALLVMKSSTAVRSKLAGAEALPPAAGADALPDRRALRWSGRRTLWAAPCSALQGDGVFFTGLQIVREQGRRRSTVYGTIWELDLELQTLSPA